MFGKLIDRACEVLVRMSQPTVTPAAESTASQMVEHTSISRYLPLPGPVVVAIPVLTTISASSDDFVPFARVKSIKPRILSHTTRRPANFEVSNAARERSIIAAQQAPLVVATVSVSPLTPPATPPPSPTSSRASSPDSPSSRSDVSFSSVSTAPTEPAPRTLSDAYFVKLHAAADFIKRPGEYLDTKFKRNEAHWHALALVESEEAYERRYDEACERDPRGRREHDDVRHARMKARIESALWDFILALYPIGRSFPQRVSFRPVQWTKKDVKRSALSYPITSRTEPDEESIQSLALLRAAANRPQTAARYHRSAIHTYQSQIAASFGSGSVSHLRRSAVLAAAHRHEVTAREALPVAAFPTFEQDLESLLAGPVAAEPSSKRWSDLDESDDDDYLSTPPVFENNPVVVSAERPAGPAATPVKLLWSDLADLDDNDYFATPLTFDDDDKIRVVLVEQPASPTAPGPLRWSDLVDLEDDDEYFASPPPFDSDKPESAFASRPAGPAAPHGKLLWSDLVDLDDADDYFASPPTFDC